MTKEEIKKAVEDTGLSATKIESKILIGRGILKKILDGKRELTADQWQLLLDLKKPESKKDPEPNDFEKTFTQDEAKKISDPNYIKPETDLNDDEDQIAIKQTEKLNSVAGPWLTQSTKEVIDWVKAQEEQINSGKGITGDFCMDPRRALWDAEKGGFEQRLMAKFFWVCNTDNLDPEKVLAILEDALTDFVKLHALRKTEPRQYPLTIEESELPKPPKRLMDFMK